MSLGEKFITYINRLQSQYYSTPYEDLVEIGIWGRVQLYDWTLEIIGLVIIAVLALLFNFGALRNKSIVENYIAAVRPVLDENFAQVGTKKDELYIKDSPTVFTTYATGRVLISGLTIKFNLISRQNFLFYLFEYAFSFFLESVDTPEDTVDIIIKPGSDSKIGNFIFGISNKNGMNKYRQDNYFLSLTKTTESETLPNSYVFMSEISELNQAFIDEELLSVLSRSTDIVRFLAISDLPVDKPQTAAELQSSPELVLRLKLKSDSKSLGLARDLVDQLIQLNDRVSKYQLKPDQLKKLNAVRANELTKIQKAIQEQKNEELREAKLEAEKQARRELEKLSPEAQAKLDKKQKEKRDRKARSKQMKRV